MSSKVSSGKNHNHSDAKPAGGYAGKGGGAQQAGKQDGKNKASAGNQQSQGKEGGSENMSSNKGSKQ